MTSVIGVVRLYANDSISVCNCMRHVPTTRYAGILLGVLFWVTTGWANASISPATTSLEDESSWLNQATRLVLEAQSARADAAQFNKDVRESRARLRNIMQQSRNIKPASKHRELHSIMLVMDVLLKSAAACQTGGHIVCPPMLMSQLKTVLKNAYTKFDEVKQTSNSFNVGGSR